MRRVDPRVVTDGFNPRTYSFPVLLRHLPDDDAIVARPRVIEPARLVILAVVLPTCEGTCVKLPTSACQLNGLIQLTYT